MMALEFELSGQSKRHRCLFRYDEEQKLGRPTRVVFGMDGC